MTIDSGTERKTTTEASKEKPDPAVVRQDASKAHFLLLAPGIRKLMLSAASASPRVLMALSNGRWDWLVGALRKLAEEKGQPKYARLADEIEPKIPNQLKKA